MQTSLPSGSHLSMQIKGGKAFMSVRTFIRTKVSFLCSLLVPRFKERFKKGYEFDHLRRHSSHITVNRSTASTFFLAQCKFVLLLILLLSFNSFGRYNLNEMSDWMKCGERTTKLVMKISPHTLLTT